MLLLQVNLFLAVLKTKFGKAQSFFRTKLEGSMEQRKNTIKQILDWTLIKWKDIAARKLASETQALRRISLDLRHGLRLMSHDSDSGQGNSKVYIR